LADTLTADMGEDASTVHFLLRQVISRLRQQNRTIYIPSKVETPTTVNILC